MFSVPWAVVLVLAGFVYFVLYPVVEYYRDPKGEISNNQLKVFSD